MTVHALMPAATGGYEFYAQSEGSDIVTDGSSWHPVTIPAGKEFTRLLIQCQKDTPAFDVSIDMTSFRTSFSATGPGAQADKLGTVIGIAFSKKKTDSVFCYVQAKSGYKIYCCLVS